VAYSIEPHSLTVSGISSGAFAAVQFHVSFSNSVFGAAIIAGGPYWCAKGNKTIALADCNTSPSRISISDLEEFTNSEASAKEIDSPSHLSTARVWLFSGLNDTIVNPGVVRKLQDYYSNYVHSSNITTVFNLQAEHSFPTLNYGNSPCTFLGPNFINKCNYDAAGIFLSYLYNELKAPIKSNPSNIVKISQSDYIPSPFTPSTASLDDNAYLYVPTLCSNSKTQCKIHISLHGCDQSYSKIGLDFVQNAGYNDWAEANNIIILYPQAKPNSLNPKGCYDWWGFTSANYATKHGAQMATIMNIVDAISVEQFKGNRVRLTN